MDQELGTDPELLWELLLAQIIYDEASTKTPDFARIAAVYRDHQLLPSNAPALANAQEARNVFNDLLKEYNVSTTDHDLKSQAALLAEPLYTKFHENLLNKMQSDATEFNELYGEYEKETNVPQDERLKEEEN